MYAEGLGVAQDKSAAAKWYRAVAEQGHAASQYTLGLRYDQGEGVSKDFAEAAKWYRRARRRHHRLVARLLAAGARGAVVTLWRIDDETAAEFIQRFYRRLQDGASPPEALLAVRREQMTADGSHPAHWAPFVLVGGFFMCLPLEGKRAEGEPPAERALLTG